MKGVRFRWVVVWAALVLAGTPLHALAQATEAEGAAALGLALRRLGTTKRVLMIAAHPDDENTAVLSTLALGDGADVAYLSLTRGEGGQNLIGPELQEGLGLIRSEELIAARRLDGASQFFTRAYDYGFSKSADEAFSHWSRDSLRADVVAVIRQFRPDIIVSVFSGTPSDGHGQHQAAGILARAAFEAAADPAQFPQLGAPHRARYLYQSRWRPTGEELLQLATGDYDVLLGRSHFQVAMASRSRHRSQDMGQGEPLGPRSSAFVLLAGARATPGGSLFAGIDTSIAALADDDRDTRADAPTRVDASFGDALRAYQDSVAAVRATFNPLTPDAIVASLAHAAYLIERALEQAPAAARVLRFRLQDERDDVHDALRLAAGIVLDATADAAYIVPGEPFRLKLSAWNGGQRAVDLRALAPVLPEGWQATQEEAPTVSGSSGNGAAAAGSAANGSAADCAAGSTSGSCSDGPTPIAPNQVVTRTFVVRAPADAQPSEPYFLRAARAGDLYTWPADSAVRGLPFEPPVVRAAVEIGIEDVYVRHTQQATHVVIDKAFGERRTPLLVVPAVSVDLAPRVLALPVAASPDARARTLTITLRSAARDTLAGTLRMTDGGWQIMPVMQHVTLPPGSARDVQVTVEPAGALSAGHVTFNAELTLDDGRTYTRGYNIIDYPHIQPRALYRPANAVVRTMPVAIAPDLTIGYIEGAGDDGALALRQLGAHVVQIDSAALADGDLGRYDAIVTGIRAYEVRNDLVRHNDRLLEFTRAGGTFIVQYNKYELVEGGYAPYPLTMARPHGRVTDESAPVRLLEPEHPALSWPNRIDASDFEGWAHERGLYFAETWDEAYTPLLAMSDAGEAPLEGSLLVAPYGSGHYVYAGIAFFRQFPEAVPGAYRLFANLVSLGSR